VKGFVSMDDGKRIVSYARDKFLMVWSLDNPPSKPLRVLEGHDDEVLGVLRLSSSSVLSWSVDGTLIFWDVNSGGFLRSTRVGTVSGVTVISPSQVVSWGSKVLLWYYDNLSSPLRLDELSKPKHSIQSVLSSPRMQQLGFYTSDEL